MLPFLALLTGFCVLVTIFALISKSPIGTALGVISTAASTAALVLALEMTHPGTISQLTQLF